MKKGLIGNLHNYFFKECRDEVLLAMREFFENPDIVEGKPLVMNNPKEQELFMEWLAFDFVLKNKNTLIEEYVNNNYHNLSQDDIKTYKSLLKDNKYGFYEVKNIKLGKWLEVKDLQRNKIIKVSENKGTHDAEIGQVLLCRVGLVIEHYELVGCDAIVIPKPLVKQFKNILKHDKSEISPINAKNLVSTGRESEEDIRNKRNEIREDFEKILSGINSSFDFDYILNIIYCENNQKDLSKIIGIFDQGADSLKIENILELTTDAWNYFPHKVLGDKAPVEIT